MAAADIEDIFIAYPIVGQPRLYLIWKCPGPLKSLMDPIGPSVSEMLPIFQQVQEHGRPLIVFGLNKEADVAKLISSLSPQGLCVFIQADTEE